MISIAKRGGHPPSIHSRDIGPIETFKTKDKILWFMFLRAMVTSLLLAITLFYQIKDSPLIQAPDLLPIYFLIGFTYAITIFCAFLVHRIRHLNYFVMAQIAYDILFTTALIYITGTQEAVFTFLYMFTIAFASILFLRTGALYTAALASICFSTLLILDPIPGSEKHLLTLLFNNVAFFLVALLAGYLSEQFRQFGIRLKAEQESVRELEDINKTIINNMKSGLLTTDLKNRIIYLNTAAEELTGLSLKHIYRKNVFEVFPNLKRHWIKDASKPKKEVSLRTNFKYKKSKADLRTFGFSLSQLKDATNEPLGYLLMFEDLTKMLELEQHLQRTDKLAAIGKLAAGIAHEIRNPLASVSGSIEVLSREHNVSSENKRLMDIVIRETDRLNDLVSEFLDYVRPTHLKKERVDIRNMLEDTILALSMNKSISKGIKVHLDSDLNEAEIPGNKEKLKQVFWNLLINAHQAMPKGGDITTRLYVQDKQLHIDISDTGEGIPEETINKIFDPFFTTKPKGTGLGLSMVHKIIEAHQGRIVVSSEKGKGTTFTIALPLKTINQGGNYDIQSTYSGR